MLLISLLILSFLLSKEKALRRPEEILPAFSILRESEYSDLEPYWFAISKMETRNFYSYGCTVQKNLFGYKFHKASKYARSSKRNDFAVYTDYHDSVCEIRDYMRRKEFPTSVGSLRELVDFMGSKGYYGNESPDSYYRKVVAWNKEFKDEEKNILDSIINN